MISLIRVPKICGVYMLRTIGRLDPNAVGPHICKMKDPNIDKIIRRFSDINFSKATDRYEPNDVTCAEHIGQRKLLNSEIEFLAHCVNELARESKSYTVVYAGAATGEHIPLLVELFKSCFKEFHLYDEPRFSKILQNFEEKNDNVKFSPYRDKSIQNGFFSEVIARKYRNNKVIFISDIRITNDNESVERDNALQERWILEMLPEWSMVKFRLPFPTSSRQTFHKLTQGDIVLQTWEKARSAETRVWIPKKNIVNGLKMRVGTVEYESAMNSFNLRLRHAGYKTYLKEVNGDNECSCYDHIVERLIYYRFLKLREKYPDMFEKMFRSVSAFTSEVNRHVKAPRSLKSGSQNHISSSFGLYPPSFFSK